MREIANIADSLSMEKMDCRDRKLLEDVKNAVHECLMDVVGESRKVKRKGAAKRKRVNELSSKDE